VTSILDCVNCPVCSCEPTCPNCGKALDECICKVHPCRVCHANNGNDEQAQVETWVAEDVR